MGLGFAVVLERDIEGIDPMNVDGRTLARHRHILDAAAHESDLPGLGEFVAFSQTEAETLAEDMKFDAPTAGAGRWFSSEKGLEVVRAIHDYLEENPDEIGESDDVTPVLAGLSQLRTILEAAQEATTRFRLSIDY